MDSGEDMVRGPLKKSPLTLPPLPHCPPSPLPPLRRLGSSGGSHRSRYRLPRPHPPQPHTIRHPLRLQGLQPPVSLSSSAPAAAAGSAATSSGTTSVEKRRSPAAYPTHLPIGCPPPTAVGSVPPPRSPAVRKMAPLGHCFVILVIE